MNPTLCIQPNSTVCQALLLFYCSLRFPSCTAYVVIGQVDTVVEHCSYCIADGGSIISVVIGQANGAFASAPRPPCICGGSSIIGGVSPTILQAVGKVGYQCFAR